MQFGPTMFHNGAQLRQLERTHKILGKALFSRSEGGPESPQGLQNGRLNHLITPRDTFVEPIHGTSSCYNKNIVFE